MTLYKVVNTDNFGGDYPDERELVWADSKGKSVPFLMRESEASRVVQKLNDELSGWNASRHFVMRPQNYVLQPGFEP